MKKFPKIVQCDKRGQIIIPKDIRIELGINENSGFYIYSITDEGILLKKIPLVNFEEHKDILTEIENKSEIIDIKLKNIEKTKEEYKKTKEGNLELI